MGGVLTGAMLGHAGRDVLLLEAMDYLGGCSGTFERSGHSYNAGATTFVGLGPALPLGYLSRILGVPLPVKSLDPSLRVHLPDRTIRLFRDRTQLMDELSRAFPDDDHQGLWRRIFRVSDAVWSMILSLPPFPPKSASELLSFLRPGSSLLMRGGPDLLRSARSVLSRHVKTSSYRNFLDQILLITNQATSGEVPFLSGALGLSYPTLDNYTVLGGMEAALEAFARKIPSVSRKTLVQKIERVGGFFRLQTTRGAFDAQRVIVNRDVWGVADLLDDPTINRQQEERKDRFRHRWGAVTLHFRIRDLFSGDFELHHQIHHDTNPWTGSRSFFLSLSDPEDDRLSAGGLHHLDPHLPFALGGDFPGGLPRTKGAGLPVHPRASQPASSPLSSCRKGGDPHRNAPHLCPLYPENGRHRGRDTLEKGVLSPGISVGPLPPPRSLSRGRQHLSRTGLARSRRGGNWPRPSPRTRTPVGLSTP